MLFIIFGILGLLVISMGIYFLKKSRCSDDGWEIGGGISIVIGSILTIAIIIIPIVVSFDNLSKMSKLEAFYESNEQNYAITVDETRDILTASLEKFAEQVLVPIEGSVEKWGQGQVVSERIAEWRDTVNQYNKDVNHMRYYDRNPWMGILYPTLPDDIKLIVIEP